MMVQGRVRNLVYFLELPLIMGIDNGAIIVYKDFCNNFFNAEHSKNI